jgi:hypothetical protein
VEEECASRAGTTLSLLEIGINLLTGYSLDCGLIPRQTDSTNKQTKYKDFLDFLALDLTQATVQTPCIDEIAVVSISRLKLSTKRETVLPVLTLFSATGNNSCNDCFHSGKYLMFCINEYMDINPDINLFYFII